MRTFSASLYDPKLREWMNKESTYPLLLKDQVLAEEMHRLILYSSILSFIFVCWKNIRVFLQRTAVSSFVSFKITFCIIAVPHLWLLVGVLSWCLAATFGCVWDTDYCISLLIASSLWTVTAVFSSLKVLLLLVCDLFPHLVWDLGLYALYKDKDLIFFLICTSLKKVPFSFILF